MRHIISAIAAAAVVASTWAPPALAKKPAKKAAKADRLSALEARLDQLEAELARRPLDISAYTLPDEVDFCGRPVNLDDPEIRERMEKEFYLVLGNRAQVVLWMKRARRVFPTIDKETKALGMCQDLKYLAVVESGLRAAVTSRASAKGYWQFMSGTGRQYGLDVGRTWDQRADLSHATKAGLTYLNDLHGRFGTWPLAMAAYNTGPGRLGKSITRQGQSDYWDLDLYTEAERYVPKIIVVKTILEDLESYGFDLDLNDGWAPDTKGFVKVTIPKGREIDVVAAARGTGIPVRTLRRMNPELGTSTLPTGRSVVLEVPAGKEGDMRTWLTGEVARLAKLAKSPKKPRSKSKRKRNRGGSAKGKAVASRGKSSKSKSSKRSRKRTHTVRSGESLWLIAEKHGCTVKQLRTWNKLTNKSVLQPGQKLVVRR